MKTRIVLLIALVTFLCLSPFPVFAADAAATESVGAQTLEVRPQHAFPRVSDYEVLSCDFHMHTIHSDGKLTPRERVLEAYRYGYDAIAITDHGNYKAYDEVKGLADCLGIVLIRGLETGMLKAEHFVVIGVSDEYQPRNPHKWSEKIGEETVYYQDELRRIAECGGIVFYPHPHVGYREPFLWGVEKDIIQGIEVKNEVVGSRWNTVKSHGTDCYPSAFDQALQHRLAVFANSDVHSARQSNEDKPVTLVLAKRRTGKGVMDAIRARGTVAWFNGMLWGREEILSKLVKSIVSIRRTCDDTGAFLCIVNRGPVALKAILQSEGIPDRPVEIGPYQEALVGLNGAADTFTVRWENLWKNPKENLQTTYTFSPAARSEK